MIIIEQDLINITEQPTVINIIESGAIIQTGGGIGDMTKAVYDPNTVNGDAFDMDNMAESATAKILTSTERANIATNNSKISSAIDDANPISINTATTLTIDKHHVISDLAVPADYTVTLPPVAGNEGRQLRIEMSVGLTKVVTVDGNGAETIDGKLLRPMWQCETATLLCDGVTWTKIAGKSIPMICVMRRANPQSAPNIVTTKILYDQIDRQSLDMGNTGLSRVDILRSGSYNVDQIMYTVFGAVTPRYASNFLVNGSITHGGEANAYSAASYPWVQPSAIIDLVAGDFCETTCYQDSGITRFFVVGATGSACIITIREIILW